MFRFVPGVSSPMVYQKARPTRQPMERYRMITERSSFDRPSVSLQSYIVYCTRPNFSVVSIAPRGQSAYWEEYVAHIYHVRTRVNVCLSLYTYVPSKHRGDT